MLYECTCSFAVCLIIQIIGLHVCNGTHTVYTHNKSIHTLCLVMCSVISKTVSASLCSLHGERITVDKTETIKKMVTRCRDSRSAKSRDDSIKQFSIHGKRQFSNTDLEIGKPC